MNNPNTTMDLVCQFLDERDFIYRVADDGNAVATGFEGRTAPFSVRVAVLDDPVRLGVFIRVPVIVPEESRLPMAEAIVRANDGLLAGCFDLDMSDGTMGYRAVMPVADAQVTRDQFRDLLYGAIAIADQYHRAFNRLLFGDDLSPAEVIAEVEMSE